MAPTTATHHSQIMNEQHVIALACVADALASSIDPTGRAVERMCDVLETGLSLTTDEGRASEAAAIIRQVLEHLDRKDHLNEQR